MYDMNFPFCDFNTKLNANYSSAYNTIINGCTCVEQGFAYTLEEHLKQFRNDENYGILYECWKVEKKEYENRLKNVNMTYQTYSLHDASHSETILRQIAYFLGEDRIRSLSPTDTWLILESAYCHDLGMVVTSKDLVRILSEKAEDNFEEISRRMYEKEDPDVQMAWSYLEPLFNPKNKGNKQINTKEYKNRKSLKAIYESEWYEWPVHFSRAFMLLIEEWCRPQHAQNSAKKIKEEAGEKSYEGLIASRLRYLIADIAVMHNENREDILRKMEKSVQGHYLDYAHPRFVAELLRIGDLLDIDNNRFNKYQLAVAGNPSYNAFAHDLKHRALRDFLVTPEQIRVRADFETKDAKELLNGDTLVKIYNKELNSKEEKYLEEKSSELTLRAFKELGGWLKSLRRELEFFSVNWFMIVPPHFTGSCPVFKPEILLLNGKEIDNDLLDLRYHITARRASEIIEGAGLYKDVFISFIREILQNAIDATKRKIAKEFEELKITEFKNPYEFYAYISKDLERISICLNCERDNSKRGEKEIYFTIRDRGIGITHKRLKSMQHIGDTHDYAWIEQAETMWEWWKPTGSFGIGMQTIFYFTKSFAVTTRAKEDGLLRKMNFHSTQVGGKIDTFLIDHVDEAKKFGYGTELEIKIGQESLRIMQEQSMWGEGSDYFGDELEIYERKVKNAVDEIYGSFGIPIIIGKPTDIQAKNELSQKGYLHKGFGDYFFDLNGNRFVQSVKEDDVPDEDMYKGFSCWDDENRIFIRYRHEEKRHHNVQIYFNEIRVNDDNLLKIVNIPFFNTEVYLFDHRADNYLEINRDAFLHEKRWDIANSICNVHLKLMEMIVSENTEKEWYKYVWQSSNGSEFYNNVREYLQFVLGKDGITFSQIGIRRFIQQGNFIHCLEEKQKIERTIEADNIWLTDSRHKFAGNAIINDNNLKSRYIVEDVMFDYMELAITELNCIREYYNKNRYFITYKTSKRTGTSMNINSKDFDLYILKTYSDIDFGRNLNRRMILPGSDAHSVLCVSRLEGNLGTSFEKRFDSSIIMPIPVEELHKWVKECETEEELRKRFKESCDGSDISYNKILDYIEDNSINKNIPFNINKINEAYAELLARAWRVLKRELAAD